MGAISQGGGVDVSGAVYGSARVPLLPVIGIDSREQAPLKFEHLHSERMTLQTGDYSIRGLEARFMVERKGGGDMLHSLTTERARFNRELERARGFEFARLLWVCSEPELDYLLHHRKMTPASLWGSLAAIDARVMPVVRVDTPAQAAELLECWAVYFWAGMLKPFIKLSVPEWARAAVAMRYSGGVVWKKS